MPLRSLSLAGIGGDFCGKEFEQERELEQREVESEQGPQITTA
jgi:hypothetical protein